MSKPPFRFKQFSVAQGKCAMRVNTDGVLLGAWADTVSAEKILDIGTGTGVIALMMAQKSTSATIDAIDIDETAYQQAKENFADSPWSQRLQAHHCALQDFAPQHKYDLIISNPPYFIDDFKADDLQKNIARHAIALSYEELINGISRLLSDRGEACIVLPTFNLLFFESLASQKNLFTIKLTEVIAVEGKEPYLVLIKLSQKKIDFSKNAIAIQNSKGEFTDEYKALAKEFYLKF